MRSHITFLVLKHIFGVTFCFRCLSLDKASVACTVYWALLSALYCLLLRVCKLLKIRNPALFSPVFLQRLALLWCGESSCRLRGPSKQRPSLRNGSGTPRPRLEVVPIQQITCCGVSSMDRRRHVQGCFFPLCSPRCCCPSNHKSKHAPCQLGQCSELTQVSGNLNPLVGDEFTLSESRRSMQEVLVCWASSSYISRQQN